MIAKLLAVPGVHRHQIGDQEAAGWVAADDHPALLTLAALSHASFKKTTAKDAAKKRWAEIKACPASSRMGP